MSHDNRPSYMAAESLKELRDIISTVDRQSPSKHDIIITFLYSDYLEVIFQCIVEFGHRNVDQQIRALQKLGDLADHIHKHDVWFLHRGKRTIKTGDRIISDDRIIDLSLSKTGDGGGFVFSVPKLGISFSQSSKSRAGILVARSHHARVL